MSDRVGQNLGNYRLIRLLGRGGFAEVYLGEHRRLGTQAALKILSARLTEADEQAFLSEARTLAQLEHPHIVRIFDFDVHEGTPFLIMSYASQGTLRERHPRGTRLPVSTVIDYLSQIALALQYAHDARIIHRDIKPENLLQGRHRELLLSDFGIALLSQSSHLQSTQTIVGTVSYMAPEQLQGKPRIASDQYSLAIVVYEWLCGERPFQGSYLELYSQHLSVPPPALQEKLPGCSPALNQVLQTALAKDPTQRFASITAFVTAFEQASQPASPSWPLPAVRPSQTLPAPSLPPPAPVSVSLDPPASSMLQPSVPSIPQSPSMVKKPTQESVMTGTHEVEELVLKEPATQIPSLDMHGVAPSALSDKAGLVDTQALIHAHSLSPTTLPIHPSSHARQMRLRKKIVVLGIGLLVLLITSMSIFYTNQNSSALYNTRATIVSKQTTDIQNSATANGSTQLTATEQKQEISTASALASATSSSITATAQVAATATSLAAQPNPYKGTLVLQDAMKQEGFVTAGASVGVQPIEGACAFINGEYHVKDACATNATIPKHFAFEIKIKTNQHGGFWHFGPNVGGFSIDISSDGNYLIDGSDTLKIPNNNTWISSSAIHTQTNQTNVCALVINGSTAIFYINYQKIIDFSYISNDVSHIELESGLYYGDTSESVFSDVRIWQL